jgi:hypothetical protein
MDTLQPFPPPQADDDPAQTHELIAHRARDLWRQLGRPADRDLEIWLEAEAEIKATQGHTLRHPHLTLADPPA